MCFQLKLIERPFREAQLEFQDAFARVSMELRLRFLSGSAKGRWWSGQDACMVACLCSLNGPKALNLIDFRPPQPIRPTEDQDSSSA